MAKCSGWYYTKPPWHKDAVTSVTGESGNDTKKTLRELAAKNNDAKIMLAYLDALAQNNERNPFGCAEPHAVCQLIEKGAELNQIYIGMTSEIRYSEYEQDSVSRRLKPCVNCQIWLTALRDGNYMIDMSVMNKFVATSKLKWWGQSSEVSSQ